MPDRNRNTEDQEGLRSRGPRARNTGFPVAPAFGVVALIGLAYVGTQAIKEGDINVLLPLDFFKLIFASIIGYLVFSEIPSLFTWIGGTMIFASATFIAYRESKNSRTVFAQTAT